MISPAPDRNGREGRLIRDKNGNEVAMVIGTPEETSDNANLIAEAPAMRDGLLAVHFAFGDSNHLVMRRVSNLLKKVGAL